jgi:hypothetical protein
MFRYEELGFLQAVVATSWPGDHACCKVQSAAGSASVQPWYSAAVSVNERRCVGYTPCIVLSSSDSVGVSSGTSKKKICFAVKRR